MKRIPPSVRMREEVAALLRGEPPDKSGEMPAHGGRRPAYEGDPPLPHRALVPGAALCQLGDGIAAVARGANDASHHEASRAATSSTSLPFEHPVCSHDHTLIKRSSPNFPVKA